MGGSPPEFWHFCQAVSSTLSPAQVHTSLAALGRAVAALTEGRTPSHPGVSPTPGKRCMVVPNGPTWLISRARECRASGRESQAARTEEKRPGADLRPCPPRGGSVETSPWAVTYPGSKSLRKVSRAARRTCAPRSLVEFAFGWSQTPPRPVPQRLPRMDIPPMPRVS